MKTALGPEKAFAFLSAFENTSQWNPCIPFVARLSDGPVQIGHRYKAMLRFRGMRETIECKVVELTPDHIKLSGGSDRLTAVESIYVRPAGEGSLVLFLMEFNSRRECFGLS